MKVSVITPSFNSAAFIAQTIESVLAQRGTFDGDLEYIIVDGASRDDTLSRIAAYGDRIDRVVSEPDHGPADAINKGFALATGDFIAWLNADDFYEPGALSRLLATASRRPGRAFYFGRCRIVDGEGREIRRPITRFKEAFFPFSCRATLQTINYVSQPATFFSAAAVRQAGSLRTDMKAAFDYDYLLRLWRVGGASAIRGPAVSNFRWHPGSISGQGFRQQFREEYEAAAADAGRLSPQAILHLAVRHSIVAIYALMEKRRMNRGR